MDVGQRLRPSCEAGHYPVGDQCELDLVLRGSLKNRQRLRPPCLKRQTVDILWPVLGSDGEGGVGVSLRVGDIPRGRWRAGQLHPHRGGRRDSRDLMGCVKLLVPRKRGSASGRVCTPFLLVDCAAGGALLTREPCSRALVACAHDDGAAGLA